MPSLVPIILAAILVGDVLWWRRADRRARRLRHAFGWRLLIGLFMGGQIALVLWMLTGRASTCRGGGAASCGIWGSRRIWGGASGTVAVTA